MRRPTDKPRLERDRARLEAIGKLIEAIGGAAFPDRLLDLASVGVRCNASMILLYRGDGPPEVLADRLVPEERPLLYGDYLSGVYRLSPFYAAAASCAQPLVRRLADVAPEGFRQSEYYRAYFSRIGVRDLMGLLVPLAGTGILHLSLSRATDDPRFTRHDRREAEMLLPVIDKACGLHWKVETGARAAPLEQTSQGALASLLPELTAREADVARAMLSGHSAKSAARLLRISVETVRVHRKHIYAKLKVGAQAQLFSLYLARLRGAGT